MKDGSRYAERVRRRFPKSSLPAAETCPAPTDPLVQLGCAILGGGLGEEAGQRALEHLRRAMVDWNEVRVSAPLELAAAVDSTIDRAVARCDALRRALNAVFDRESRMSLDGLRSMKIRDARQFLTSLDGADEFAAASVVLWSLGGHAIPVDDRTLDALRREDLIHPDASRAEVQAFLERAVPAAQARPFCVMLRAWGAAHPRDESTPPSTAKKAGAAAATHRRKAASRAATQKATLRKRPAADNAGGKPRQKTDKGERQDSAGKTGRAHDHKDGPKHAPKHVPSDGKKPEMKVDKKSFAAPRKTGSRPT